MPRSTPLVILRWVLLVSVASVVSFLAAITACAPQETPKRPPNLILILADDLGRADVGFVAGTNATPSIDRIAREGVELRNFYASPLCSLTRAALLTGREPGRLGLVSVVRPWDDSGLPPELPTLAELLRDQGYATALMGKWHLGHARRSHWPQAHGFEHFYGSLGGAIDYVSHTRLHGLDWQRNGESLREPGYATDLVRDEALRWLADQTGPYFMMLSFHAPHPPRKAPKELLRRHKAKPPAERLLAAVIDSLDAAIGEVLDEVERRGELDNTFVVFLSDNGAGSTKRTLGLRGDKGTVYEGGVRVPAAIRAPGLRAGASEQRISAEDLFATLGDALGIAVPASIEGESVWSELQNGTSRERAPMFLAADSRDERGRALLDGRWKLVQEFERGAWKTELFDIASDPSEARDVRSENAEIEAQLSQRLSAWYDEELHAPVRQSDDAPRDWKAPDDVASAAAPN